MRKTVTICRRIICFCLALFLVALSGCGSSTSTPTQSTSSASTKTAVSGTLSADGSATNVTAPAGNTLAIQADTTMTTADGTPVSGTSIPTTVVYSSSATDLPSEAQTLPTGTTLAGFLDISIGDATTGFVKEFSKAVSVTMNVSSGRFSAGDPVVIYSFDSTNKNWVLEDTVFAASDGTVKFSIKHLSVWAAFKDDTPPPGRPSGIQASGADAKVTVQWTAPATGATSYNIYYNTASGVTPSNYLGKIENAVSPQDVTGLTNGTTYYFVVTAINTGGESGPSSEKSATPGSAPGTPTKVTVTAGSGQITVQWNTVTYATDYNIYYSSVYTTTDDLLVNGTRVSANALSADPQPTTQTQVIPSLTTGTTYYFIVTSQNAYGESGGQNTPKPLAPN